MNPLKTLESIPGEVKTLVVNLISDAKIEAQIAALDLVLTAEQAGAKATQDFLQSKIADLKSQLKPL